MAIDANTNWEVRTTGSADNGGGFSASTITRATITDLAHVGGSLTVTSVIGGFTTYMVGHMLEIVAGVGFNLGWYTITVFNTANSIDLDISCGAGAGSGGDIEIRAQVHIADLAHVGGSTTVTSAASLFTVDMEGHTLEIMSGTNLIAGHYTVVTYVDVDEIILDRSCGAVNGSGGEAFIGGIDYSQQNAEQLDITDLDHAAGSLTVTSATGVFTEAMVGNVMHIISGTNMTVGWYQIVMYNTANSVDLDRSCNAAGGAANGHAHIGGATISVNTIDAAITTYNIVWIKNATHNLGAIYTPPEVSKLIGYNVTRRDSPTGDNRPLIECSTAYYIDSAARTTFMHLRVQGSAAYLFRHYASYFINCKLTATEAAGAISILKGTGLRVVDCEFTSVANSGTVTVFGDDTDEVNVVCIGCYFHDNINVIQHNDLYNNNVFIHCIFDTLEGDALYFYRAVDAALTFIDCDFYNLAADAYESAAGTDCGNVFFNNIFHTVADTAVKVSSYSPVSYYNYQHMYNNGANYSGPPAGANDTTGDPLFTDPGGGDFSLQVGSPCRETGKGMTFLVG